MIEINRIYNEDCFNIFPNIDDKSIDMVLCDLPYQVTNNKTYCSWDVKLDLIKLWKEYERIIKDNGAIILTAVHPFTTELINSNLKLFKYELIWEKESLTNIFQVKFRPGVVHENILVFYKNKPTYNPQMVKVEKPTGIAGWNKTNPEGLNIPQNENKRESLTHSGQKYKYAKDHDRNYKYPISVLRIKRDSSGRKQKDYEKHPTRKPVALFEWLIKSYSNEGDLILDNCSGSGTTALACLNTNRNYICIEKEKTFYENSIKRINARNS